MIRLVLCCCEWVFCERGGVVLFERDSYGIFELSSFYLRGFDCFENWY